jgi:NitT/TauT family transport system permease protein
LSDAAAPGAGPAAAAGGEPDAAATGAAAAPDGADRAVPFRGRGFVPGRNRLAGWLTFAVLLAVLEVGTRTGVISNLTMPPPSDVARTLWHLAASGLLWANLGPSLARLGVGSAIGVGAGILTGLAIGLFTLARAGLVPLVSALFPIPKIALLPLFVIWFGIGEGSKYAVIAFGTFTPTVVATFGAVDAVDRSLIRMAQSFGVPWWRIVRHVVLPEALAGILSGLRVSLAIGIVLLVAAEMLGARYGIGAYILEAGALYDLERLFAGVVILSVLGLILSAAIGMLERRLLRWRG